MENKVRILIAEDDRDVLDLVAFKLEQAGFEVSCVESGYEALEEIASNCPRLLILDYMIPGLSGLDVLRKIRANLETKNLDVILLTARAGDSDIDAGFASGANDYITKPFNPGELVRRVQALLARG
jgi:DNA-binding response OmpR family regulator